MKQYRAALAALDHELNRINRTIGKFEQGELQVLLRGDEHSPVTREELINTWRFLRCKTKARQLHGRRASAISAPEGLQGAVRTARKIGGLYKKVRQLQ